MYVWAVARGGGKSEFQRGADLKKERLVITALTKVHDNKVYM